MFTMRLIGKFDLLHQLVHVDTESGQLRRCECVDQIDPAYTLSRNFVHRRGGCAPGKVGQPPPAGCAHHFW